MPPLHLVCFAPYTNWSIHSARQITILQALRLRGCSVSYVACDGAFRTCDMVQPANGAAIPPGTNACLICQSSVAARLAAWGMPYRWFGRWLTTADDRTAETWIDALSPRAFGTARYTGPAEGKPEHERWDIGAWVRSSVHTHLRYNELDLDEPRVADAYRQYLRVGLVTAFGVSRLFARERPHAQLLFNGRMSCTRVALEIAKQRGIRTLVEERATVAGRLTLFEDTHCIDHRAFQALWQRWKDVPLDRAEIEAAATVFGDRWTGRSTDVSAFSRRREPAAAIYRRLHLDPDRPLWVLFTSTLDESIDESRATDAFRSQADWITATLAQVRQRPDVQLVIRAHPNSGSSRSLGHNPQDEALYSTIAGVLPENARFIASDDDTSSYALAAAADLGLIWYSTIGLEMAAIGKPVVRVGSSWLQSCDGFIGTPDPAAYAAAIAAALDEDSATRARRTLQIWRFAYCWYFRHTLAFPLVKQPLWYVGEPAYASLDELAPGRDATLDHVCAVLMDGAPLHAAPQPQAAPNDDEAALVLAQVGQLRAEAA